MTTWKQIDEMQQRPTSEEDAQLIREWETYLRIQRLVAEATGNVFGFADPLEDSDGENQ